MTKVLVAKEEMVIEEEDEEEEKQKERREFVSADIFPFSSYPLYLLCHRI